MKKWTDDFLARCLAGIPRSAYRSRVQAELEDHLLCLAEDLTASSDDFTAAQSRALELMGAPNKLNEHYKMSFQQWLLRRPSYHLKTFSASAYIVVAASLALIFACFPTFVGDTFYGYSQTLLNTNFTPALAAVNFLQFIVPYSISGIYLRSMYSLHPHPFRFITGGLLCGWAGITAIALSSPLGVAVFPTCNVTYILCSFLGCFMMGAICSLHCKPGGDPA